MVNGGNYEAILAELEAEKAAIETAIAVIKRRMGQGGGVGVGAGGGKEIRPDTFYGLGVLDAAKKYLAMVREPQTSSAIAAALEKGGIEHRSSNFAATVNTILGRDGLKKGMVRLKNGAWGLAEWYPGAKTKRSKTAKDEETEEETEVADPEATESDAASSSAP